MYAQVSLERFAPFVDSFQASHCGRGTAVVPAQIDQRSFAFENRVRGRGLFPIWAISGDVGPITATWQRYFHRARGITLCLRPKSGQTFEPSVRFGFAVPIFQALIHFMSSRAQ